MLVLLFHVGQVQYAVECDEIVEILPKVALEKRDLSIKGMAGYLNYAGTPIPIYDFCELIEGRVADSLLHTRIVLFNHFGIIVEKAIQVVELAKIQESGIKTISFNDLNQILPKEKVLFPCSTS